MSKPIFRTACLLHLKGQLYMQHQALSCKPSIPSSHAAQTLGYKRETQCVQRQMDAQRDTDVYGRTMPAAWLVGPNAPTSIPDSNSGLRQGRLEVRLTQAGLPNHCIGWLLSQANAMFVWLLFILRYLWKYPRGLGN